MQNTVPGKDSRSSKNVVLGTAGHIDHGKSSLVKALTGIDPDRLKEEKERGITIDLGFASIVYPDGLTVGIVDVPGHEKLIKNMLAGAGGIDILLMVIAADEGIMPQSREHLAICELLKIKSGIIAVTKTDMVDEEWLALVIDDIRGFTLGTFLEGAALVPVSSRTMAGIEHLMETIGEIAREVKPKMVDGIFRLPIDRVFTLKGFGTVVTGTALSGTIRVETPVEILPTGIPSRVRGLQSHGRTVETACAGQRIGLNLQGTDKDKLRRGDMVVPPGRFVPARRIDVTLEMLEGAPTLKNRSTVHFYSGTSETIARVVFYRTGEAKAGEHCSCQFRLEEPVVALSGDRFIIRRFSPLETIGGGMILDPCPPRRMRDVSQEDLAVYEKGTVREKIETRIRRSAFGGCTVPEIEGWIAAGLGEIRSSFDKLAQSGMIVKVQDAFFHKDTLESFRRAVTSTVGSFHRDNPLKTGMTKEDMKNRIKGTLRGTSDTLFHTLSGMDEIVIEQDCVRLRDFRVSLSTAGGEMREKVLSAVGKGAFQPPFKAELAQQLAIREKDAGDYLSILAKEGKLVRINDSLYLTKERFDEMMDLLRAFVVKKTDMSVAEFRDMLGTTRKYALPFLEYLDANKITLRIGDVRKVVIK